MRIVEGSLLLLMIVSLCLSQPYSVCWNGDSDCPACKNDTSNLNFTSLLILSVHPDIVLRAMHAQEIIKEYDGILQLQPLYFLHTSLNYMCCYSEEQLQVIMNVTKAYKWSTIHNITYTNITCNIDHDGITIYITAEPDAAGQKALFAWATGLQEAIQAAGVPVTHPRVQDFHMTLARVNHTYPTNVVVEKLTGYDFGSVDFDWFEFNGEIIHAKENKEAAQMK